MNQKAPDLLVVMSPLNLDELMAMVEADIRKSPINIYRREKGTGLAMSVKEGKEGTRSRLFP